MRIRKKGKITTEEETGCCSTPYDIFVKFVIVRQGLTERIHFLVVAGDECLYLVICGRLGKVGTIIKEKRGPRDLER
jgi:hypothetical protein